MWARQAEVKMAEASPAEPAVEDALEAARSHGYGLPEGAGSHAASGGHVGHGGHSGPPDTEPGVTTTVRTTTYRDRELRIETTYRVTIDGEPLPGMVEVLEDGRVHYHALPQYATPSAVEMLRRVVDYFGSKPEVEDEIGPAVEEVER